MNTTIMLLKTMSLHIPIFTLIKQLNHLEKVSQLKAKGSEQDELVLFMLSCLYFSAAGHVDFNELEQKAELLNIKGFTEIKALFFQG